MGLTFDNVKLSQSVTKSTAEDVKFWRELLTEKGAPWRVLLLFSCMFFEFGSVSGGHFGVNTCVMQA